jgi:hypothetical protein
MKVTKEKRCIDERQPDLSLSGLSSSPNPKEAVQRLSKRDTQIQRTKSKIRSRAIGVSLQKERGFFLSRFDLGRSTIEAKKHGLVADDTESPSLLFESLIKPRKGRLWKGRSRLTAIGKTSKIGKSINILL